MSAGWPIFPARASSRRAPRTTMSVRADERRDRDRSGGLSGGARVLRRKERRMIAALTMMEAFHGARRDARSLRGQALRAHQDRRAQAMVAYAVARAPFYARHYRDRDLGDWRALPTIDKRAMMENFGEINTRGVALDEAMNAALTAERTRDFRPT